MWRIQHPTNDGAYWAGNGYHPAWSGSVMLFRSRAEAEHEAEYSSLRGEAVRIVRRRRKADRNNWIRRRLEKGCREINQILRDAIQSHPSARLYIDAQGNLTLITDTDVIAQSRIKLTRP